LYTDSTALVTAPAVVTFYGGVRVGALKTPQVGVASFVYRLHRPGYEREQAVIRNVRSLTLEAETAVLQLQR
jgi:hypothetical protein